MSFCSAQPLSLLADAACLGWRSVRTGSYICPNTECSVLAINFRFLVQTQYSKEMAVPSVGLRCRQHLDPWRQPGLVPRRLRLVVASQLLITYSTERTTPCATCIHAEFAESCSPRPATHTHHQAGFTPSVIPLPHVHRQTCLEAHTRWQFVTH
jgi:hypothetical protein